VNHNDGVRVCVIDRVMWEFWT